MSIITHIHLNKPQSLISTSRDQGGGVWREAETQNPLSVAHQLCHPGHSRIPVCTDCDIMMVHKWIEFGSLYMYRRVVYLQMTTSLEGYPWLDTNSLYSGAHTKEQTWNIET